MTKGEDLSTQGTRRQTSTGPSPRGPTGTPEGTGTPEETRPSPRSSAAVPVWSRRRFLGAGLTTAAVLTSRAPGLLARRSGIKKGGTQAGAPLPVLTSRAGTPGGPVHHYRSRPDLAPAVARTDINRPGQAPGLIFMDSQGGNGQEGPMIIDAAGALVWFRTTSVDPGSLVNRAFDLRVQTYRGKPVLTWFDGSVVDAHGVGEDVIMDTAYREVARVGGARGLTADLHEFRLTPAGTALITCYPLAYGDLSPVGGALGSVQAMVDGHIFIGWGLLAGFSEFGPDGRVLLDGRLSGNDAQSYRAFRSVWSATPTEPPALVADRHGSGTTLYASWNGATEVVNWRVLGGASPSELKAVGVAPKAGFETVIELGGAVAHVAVGAIDGHGQELGRSAVIAT